MPDLRDTHIHRILNLAKETLPMFQCMHCHKNIRVARRCPTYYAYLYTYECLDVNVYIEKYIAKMKFTLCLKVDSCKLACAVHDDDSFSFSFICFNTLAIRFLSLGIHMKTAVKFTSDTFIYILI